MPIVKNLTLQAEVRNRGRCEWCKTPRYRLQCVHVYARGRGNATQIDIPINLFGACLPLDLGSCNVHESHHQSSRPSRAELVEFVAKRDGITVEQWWEQINHWLRREKPNEARKPKEKKAPTLKQLEQQARSERARHKKRMEWIERQKAGAR